MDEMSQRQKAFSKERSKIRVLAVYRIIQEGKRVSTKEILRKLRMHYSIIADRKTIYDDIRAINRFIPIDAIPGPKGGYQIHDFSEVFDDE